MSDDKLMQILFSDPAAAKAPGAMAPMDKDDDTEDTPPTILASDPRMRSAVDEVLRGLMLTPRRGSKAKVGGRSRAARPAPVIEPGLSPMTESVDDAVEAAPPSPPAFEAPPGQPAVLAPPESTASKRIDPMVSARVRPAAPAPAPAPVVVPPSPPVATAPAVAPAAAPGWAATGSADTVAAARAGAPAKETTSSVRPAASAPAKEATSSVRPAASAPAKEATSSVRPAASAPAKETTSSVRPAASASASVEAPTTPATGGWSSASAPSTNPAMRPHLAARSFPPAEPSATSRPLSAARTPPPSEPSTRWPPPSRVGGEPSNGGGWPAANARSTPPVDPAGWSASPRAEAAVDEGPSWQGSSARQPRGARAADAAGPTGALPTASPWQGPPARPGPTWSPSGWDDSSVAGDVRANAERTGGKHRTAAWDADAMLDESSASQKRTKVVVESSLRSPRSVVTLHGEEPQKPEPPAVVAPPERHAVLVVVALGVALAVLLVVALLQDLLAMGV